MTKESFYTVLCSPSGDIENDLYAIRYNDIVASNRLKTVDDFALFKYDLIENGEEFILSFDTDEEALQYARSHINLLFQAMQRLCPEHQADRNRVLVKSFKATPAINSIESNTTKH